MITWIPQPSMPPWAATGIGAAATITTTQPGPRHQHPQEHPAHGPGSRAETVGLRITGKGTGGGSLSPTPLPTSFRWHTHSREDSCVGTAFPVAPSPAGTSHTEVTAQATWCLQGPKVTRVPQPQPGASGGHSSSPCRTATTPKAGAFLRRPVPILRTMDRPVCAEGLTCSRRREQSSLPGSI